ncbi:MAG: response regulator [Bacteroidota bacterium]
MKKILVIEDNFDFRDNLLEILSLSNYDVDGAENGRVGVTKALQNPPDLIVCDVMMPELDGYGVLHILAKKPQTAEIPFVFLTAKSEAVDFRKAMNLGADDYLTKPLDPHELLEVIDMRIRKSERIKKAFDGTYQGFHNFIDEARGQKEFEKLSQAKETRRFRKKDFVYREGDAARRLYFIISGRVKTFRVSDQGKEYITQLYGPGDFLGYQALIRGESYAESAMCMEHTELALIPAQDFTSLLYSNRDFSARFIKMLAKNIEQKESQLLSLAYNSIRQRVAEVLLRLHRRNQEKGKEQISITRGDFAAMVGTAKESVIRTLTEFKSEGLIKIWQGNITVLQVEALEKVVLL